MSRFLLAIALITLASTAQAVDRGFYLGVSLGQANIEASTDDFHFDADDLGLKAFGGFRFADHFGIEASYVDFGSPSDVVDDIDIDNDSHAIDAFAVGFIPVAGFDLFGKVGLVNWKSDFDISDLDFSDDDDGTDLAYGVGAQFRLGSAAIRAEYEVFDFADDVNMLSIGVSWTFF